MVPITYYLILSAIIFTIGAVGVLSRRNALIIIMCDTRSSTVSWARRCV